MSLAPSPRRFVTQPFRFAAVGVVNSAVGLATIFLAKLALDLGDAPANALGYSVGLIVSFLLNASWTFRYRGTWLGASVRYLGAFAVSYALNLFVVLSLIRLGDVNPFIAQGLGVPPYAICFYVISKWGVFRPPGADGSRQP